MFCNENFQIYGNSMRGSPRVEIEHYSVAYFDHITKALMRRTSIKGGAHMRCVK